MKDLAIRLIHLIFSYEQLIKMKHLSFALNCSEHGFNPLTGNIWLSCLVLSLHTPGTLFVDDDKKDFLWYSLVFFGI